MKKLGRVEGKVYRKNVYAVTKDGVKVFEGTTDEVVEYLNGSRRVFNSTLWRCRRFRKPLKYKGHILTKTQICTGERVYAVIGRHNGKEVIRGSIRKLAAEFGYKMGTIKNYISIGKPLTIRRKKYDLVPTGEYDILWKRAK